MHSYELVVVSDGIEDAQSKKVLEDVKKTVLQAQGEITKTDEWGVRPMAYPIKKKVQAMYYFFEVSLPSTAVAQVNGMLRVHDNVLRYLLLKKAGVEKAQVAQEVPKVQKVSKVKKTRVQAVKKTKRAIKGGEK